MSEFRIVFTRPEDGGVSVIVPAPGVSEADAIKALPSGASSYHVCHMNDIPTDRTFRNAWKKEGNAVGHDLVKAKDIAHEKRRAARTTEFAPLDVEATIPSKAAQAEAKRQVIRNKYDTMQADIDAAGDVSALKNILGV